MGVEYGDYIVYVDESGDHGLSSIDPQYPIFVLAFCIIHKSTYSEHLVPAFHKFKFHHFGHDQVILHESDIRKDRGEFSFLKTPKKKSAFIEELTQIVDEVPFTLITAVIKKKLYKQRYTNPDNPYHIALGFGLERVFYYLRAHRGVDKTTHVIVEKRGKKEDAELELEFRRVCDGANYEQKKLPFEVVFSDKKSNSAGLQLADLIARPVGLSISRPEQKNRAYEIVEKKFYRSNSGKIQGCGLKCFP